MHYIMGVALPALFQCLLVFIIIAMNTGNGSFLGLAAFLIAMIAVPVTAIINAGYINARKDKPGLYLYTVPNCFMIALVTPIIVAILLVIG